VFHAGVHGRTEIRLSIRPCQEFATSAVSASATLTVQLAPSW
jgi:hypothetical protein